MMIPSGAGIVRVPDSVFINYDAIETIEENAFAEAPRECCGLLLGRFGSLEPAKVPAAEHALRGVEHELGLEFGEMGGSAFNIPLPDVLTVEEAVPTRNASPEPTRYLIDPEDHFRVVREARRRGLDIVGAYHSHAITRPMPSETDVAEAHPHFLYVIASPDWDTGEGCDIRAWWLVETGNFQELTIVPVP